MRKSISMVWVLLLLLLVPLCSGAARVAGVSIPDQASPEGMGQTLQLNGAGIRKKFFFKIYIGALYLPAVNHSASEVIESDAPNRVLMHFLYDEVSREKLSDGWKSGFKANHDRNTLNALEPRIEQFTKLFVDARKGDRIWIDYLPGTGTRVTMNGTVQGIIPGADFNRALLRIWLGDEPVTDDLKQAMLGVE